MLNIDFLRSVRLTVGYSNHVIGSDAVMAAAARGAAFLKFILPIRRMAAFFATTPCRWMRMILELIQLSRIASSLGSAGNLRQPCERQNLAAMRKGIIAARPLDRGTVLSQDDIMFARPEIGFLLGG